MPIPLILAFLIPIDESLVVKKKLGISIVKIKKSDIIKILTKFLESFSKILLFLRINIGVKRCLNILEFFILIPPLEFVLSIPFSITIKLVNKIFPNYLQITKTSKVLKLSGSSLILPQLQIKY